MRRSTRIAAALLAFGLTAAACGSDADGDAAGDERGADVESTERAEPDTIAEEPIGDAVAIDDLSDDELAEYLLGLSDDEFEAITADLDDEEYDELLDTLDAYVAAGSPSTGDATELTETADGQDDADDAGEAGADPTTASSASRDDVDCTPDGLGADDEFTFTTAHFVVDGTLGEVCLGDADDRLTQAWDALATIAPQGQLGDLGVFTGFEASEESEEVTLAFVNALDDDGSLFQMSINLDEYEADPDEALLTMAHEFSHVFTSLPSQLDRTAEAEDSCETYYNGEGCYLDDSIMYQWIEMFWGDGLIDQIDPFAEATGADGQERCDADPGFFGAYAASTPEEDFAESFSVFVFDVETFTDEQQARIDWIAAQPGLAEYRDRRRGSRGDRPAEQLRRVRRRLSADDRARISADGPSGLRDPSCRRRPRRTHGPSRRAS